VRLARAAGAFAQFRHTTAQQRARLLANLAATLDAHESELAALIAEETSKSARGAHAEIAKCAALCRWYAAEAARILAPSRAGEATLVHEPLGVIVGIQPSNFPFWQVFRFAVPTLVAGNAVIVKHSPHVPRCAARIERLFAEAGWPEHVAQCESFPVAEAYDLIANEAVRGVAFTGTESVGRTIASFAGRHLKKVVLELGGSDPFLVFASADIEAAAQAAVESRLYNSGQACTAAKRFIVVESVASRFTTLVIEAMRRSEIAPLITVDAAARLERQLAESVRRGARVLTGGRRIGARAFEPTLVADVRRGTPLYDEETFGPVAALFRVRDAAEAIELANDTPFGLGASVWSQDEHEIARCEREIAAGQIAVNAPVHSTFALPFGGTKSSGFGRELGDAGVYEFTNLKAIRRAACEHGQPCACRQSSSATAIR
jgi:succinate-semialdehyde dehydrogenase / glutarate-semialdehyde dehydrogenase